MHCALNLIEVGHIHLQRDGAPAQRPDFGGQPRIRMDVPQPQCHVGPGVGERQRNRPAKAAGRAGDKGYLIRKGETGKRIQPIRIRPEPFPKNVFFCHSDYPNRGSSAQNLGHPSFSPWQTKTT